MNRGRGTRPFRGRGVKTVGCGAAAGGDARDKLIISRRAIGDARAVIGQHVVEKVGDLRTMLAPKRGISRGRGVRGRGRGGGRPVGDLRAGLTKTYKPELVYEDELQTNGKISHQHHRPKPALDSNITLGRGGRMTISRSRGRSIDRDLEPVQPTGIPAHMRRQPSPPPPREFDMNRSLSPPPARGPPTVYRRQSPPPPRRNTAYNGRHRSFTPSPPPPNRPQSYIVSPRKRMSPPRRHPHEDFAPMGWERDRGGGGRMRSDFIDRPRSRSPLDRFPRRRSPSPLMRRMSPGRYYSRRSPTPPRYRRSPSPDRWRTRSPTPPTFRRRSRSPSPARRRAHPMRSYSRSMTPPSRDRAMEKGEELRHTTRHPYGDAAYDNDSSLRMDRVSRHNNNTAAPSPADSRFKEKIVEKRRKLRSPSVESEAEQPVFYTIKVTNLSADVSQEDVEELFGDVGTLLSARLVAQGYAEVRFLNKKDAKTAIEKYDRRELDGIPMNLKMVEPSSSALNKSSRPKSSIYR